MPIYRQVRRDAGHRDGADDVTVLAPTYTGSNAAAIRRDVEPGIAQLVAVSLRRLSAWISAAPPVPKATPNANA